MVKSQTVRSINKLEASMYVEFNASFCGNSRKYKDKNKNGYYKAPLNGYLISKRISSGSCPNYWYCHFKPSLQPCQPCNWNMEKILKSMQYFGHSTFKLLRNKIPCINWNKLIYNFLLCLSSSNQWNIHVKKFSTKNVF